MLRDSNLNVNEKDDFISSFFTTGLAQIRIVSIVFIFLFLADGLLSAKPMQNESIFFAVRYYTLIPIMALVIGLSFTKFFVRISQPIMLFAFIISGCGVATLLILDPTDQVLLGLLILVELAGFLFIRLKFQNAVIGGIAIFVFYIFGIFEFTKLAPLYVLPMFILLTGAIIIGSFGNYFINSSELRNYLMKKQYLTDKKRQEKIMSEKVKEISDSQTVTIFALAKLSESRDKDTGNHIERVGKYCLLLASKIENKEYEKRNLTKEDFISRIELASALHDIGKVGIGDSILIKPGKLNAEEFQIMTCHTLIGSNTLDEVRKKYPNNSFINMGIEITRCHHERFDGTGYPHGLVGEQIPLSARIVAIADVYDALISTRPYKDPYPHERAMDIIVNLSGYQFDPMLIRIFEKCNKEIKSIAYGHQHSFRILEDDLE